MRQLFLALILVVFNNPVWAADATSNNDSNPDWVNLGFGIGVGYVAYQTPNVESASVYNGIVHIDKQQTGTPGIWLEAHNFFSMKEYKNAGWGPFFAIQTGGTNNQTIGAYAIGIMIGTKKQSVNVSTETQKQPEPVNDTPAAIAAANAATPITVITNTPVTAVPSFNVGIGVAAINMQTLGDGVQDGHTLPTGETSVRYKTITSYAPVIMMSFMF